MYLRTNFQLPGLCRICLIGFKSTQISYCLTFGVFLWCFFGVFRGLWDQNFLKSETQQPPYLDVSSCQFLASWVLQNAIKRLYNTQNRQNHVIMTSSRDCDVISHDQHFFQYFIAHLKRLSNQQCKSQHHIYYSLTSTECKVSNPKVVYLLQVIIIIIIGYYYRLYVLKTSNIAIFDLSLFGTLLSYGADFYYTS